MGRFRYKRFFLFLVALILPSVVIALLGWRNAEQKRELDVKRLADEERSAKDSLKVQVRAQILALLEKIKSDESAAAVRSSEATLAMYSNPAVRLVGRNDGGRLILPWEITPGTDMLRQSTEEGDFAFKIREAERFEFGEPAELPKAEELYAHLVSSAEASGNLNQTAYSRLRLARTLRKSGKYAQALPVYRQLLSLPSTVVDDQGLPFTLLAATAVSEMHNADRDVLDRLAVELESPTLLTTTNNAPLKSVLEELGKSHDSSVARDAARANEKLSKLDTYLEQVRKLQADFPNLRVTPSDWQPYGTEQWLVGTTQGKGNSRPLVVAVRAESVFRDVQSTTDSQLRFDITAAGAAGEPLGENLPGLHIAFRPADRTGIGHSGAQITPSVFWLPLVVALTLLGGYLLWRDTRRESRMAEMRSQFVSSVSHELKTPLTSIRMFAETLQMNDTSTPPETRAEYLDTIVNETERLTRLLNNVLDFSRIERGQKNYNMHPTALAEVVESAVRTMHFPLTQQGFDLRVNVCDGIPPVRADRDAIEQAILNLLNNAMKYSGKSRGIELQLCSLNGSAVIQVKDRGIGIPAEEQKRVFQRFYRVATPENRAISGTGLGLSLVAHIAEAHGGSVEVQSSPGEGSTFSIRLPLNGSHPS